jgi:colicin import membrane protein
VASLISGIKVQFFWNGQSLNSILEGIRTCQKIWCPKSRTTSTLTTSSKNITMSTALRSPSPDTEVKQLEAMLRAAWEKKAERQVADKARKEAELAKKQVELARKQAAEEAEKAAEEAEKAAEEAEKAAKVWVAEIQRQQTPAAASSKAKGKGKRRAKSDLESEASVSSREQKLDVALFASPR